MAPSHFDLQRHLKGQSQDELSQNVKYCEMHIAADQ